MQTNYFNTENLPGAKDGGPFIHWGCSLLRAHVWTKTVLCLLFIKIDNAPKFSIIKIKTFGLDECRLHV